MNVICDVSMHVIWEVNIRMHLIYEVDIRMHVMYEVNSKYILYMNNGRIAMKYYNTDVRK